MRRRGPARALLAAAAAALALGAAAQPSFEAVRAAHRPSDIALLDRHGSVLQRVRLDSTVRRGDWVALADVSPALRHALVLGEDRRFWQHGGVDWAALAAGAWAAAFNERARGASTLTMQLAALLDPALARPAGGRDAGDKLAQVLAAQRLERRWSKAQILEAYLNAVPLRGELVGLRAASLQLFGKQPSGLDGIEAALLAALVRAPNAAPAVVERRACELLRLQQLDCAAVAITWAQARARPPGPLLPAGTAADEAVAPHLARLVAQGFGAAVPAAMPSTLDARVQRLALAALRRQLAELRGRGVEDGAVVVLDNRSGELLAWVGSAGRGASAPAVDAVLARRQPGSTLKPLVYGLALQQRLVTPASLLDDRPLAMATGDGALYRPRNYDEAFRGFVSVREALAASLNVPAVRVATMLGPDAVFDGLVRAGLRPARHAGWHGHALALGSADATLLDLANAYRALANGGRWSAPRWTAPAAMPAWAQGAPRELLPPAVAWQLAHMLSDPAARAATFGLDSPLVTRGFAAVKTGTSKDLRDNWCVGFSDRFTVAVWVGNAGGQPMHGVSGSEGAAPVWRELMQALHEGQPSRAPAPPPGLVEQGGEWFLAGTELRALAQAQTLEATPAAFGVTSPREGALIVLDPDIPLAAQRLVFEGEPGRWVLGGRELGRGARIGWLPRPGRHVLEHHGPGGVQRVRFEVRAAPLPRHPGAGFPGPG